MFELDDRLAKDTIHLASWPLCEVRLMLDKSYPWVILVPRAENLTELYHLDESQRLQLDQESNYLSVTLMEQLAGDKLNVAALGNMVSQLHIHHVVRYRSDIAWPAPVWGKHPVNPYSDKELTPLLEKLAPIKEKCWA